MSTATNIRVQIQSIHVASFKRFQVYNDIQNSFANAKIGYTFVIVKLLNEQNSIQSNVCRILISLKYLVVKYLLEHVHKSRQKYKNDLDISYYRTNLYYRRFNQVSGHAIAHWFINKCFEPRNISIEKKHDKTISLTN